MNVDTRTMPVVRVWTIVSTAVRIYFNETVTLNSLGGMTGDRSVNHSTIPHNTKSTIPITSNTIVSGAPPMAALSHT